MTGWHIIAELGRAIAFLFAAVFLVAFLALLMRGL